MPLFRTIKNLFTDKKKKEEKFAQMMRSSPSNVADYIESMDEKGLASLEGFQKLGMKQAQDWLNERSKELFNDDPERKIDFCRRFQYGRTSSIPVDQRSAMAVYFAAFSYFLLEKDAEDMKREMAQETGELCAMQKLARKAMVKAEKDVAQTERTMRNIDKAIDQMNAQTERTTFGHSSQRG